MSTAEFTHNTIVVWNRDGMAEHVTIFGDSRMVAQVTIDTLDQYLLETFDAPDAEPDGDYRE